MIKEIKKEIVAGEELPVMEAFYTIQGEGMYQGVAAYFIRLGGCDVGCHWCDVKESWNADEHPVHTVNKLVSAVPTHVEMVVITGGEPLTWNMDKLTKALHEKGKRVHIETSGAYKVTGQWDWFCLSPKKRKLPTEKSYALANELKVIIYNKNDFVFAEEQAAKVGPDCMLLMQPEWSKRDVMTPLIVDYVKKNTKWRISLQTHKYIDVP
ncbi:MAG TPA: 7-carboxy-7-deazaguanine synthase QueE [Flavobacteriaceae bacterium]|nr:7-carboxy-7-deazaguanine synthase QueE [Flavobacteriaceae bacterium]